MNDANVHLIYPYHVILYYKSIEFKKEKISKQIKLFTLNSEK